MFRPIYTAFLKALVALDFIKIATEQELKGIMYAIADKNRRIPKEGYKDWHIDYTNEKTFCEKIGNKLKESYNIDTIIFFGFNRIFK